MEHAEASVSRRTSSAGFTLVELLTAIAIIAVLLGLLLPALAVIRERQRKATAAGRVAELHMAAQAYAAEDRRHRYPGMNADGCWRWSPDPATAGNLNLLLDAGHAVGVSDADRSGAAPYAIADPWGRPYRYQVDQDLSIAGPQRPLDLPAWNAAGARPWAYIWSPGRSADSDGRSWIYQRDDQ